MIRPFDIADSEVVIGIWLDASIIAHNFMPADYWRNEASNVRNIYLPSATTYIYEDSGTILGFISMVENFVAALFVSPHEQGKGVGKQLLDFAKQQYKTIGLAVYKENERSVVFYKKQGFKVIREGIDEHTGHVEIVMKFEEEQQ